MMKIFDIFGDSELVRNTVEKDIHKEPNGLSYRWSFERNFTNVFVQVSLRLLKAHVACLWLVSFDPRRYDLAAVGRYKINKKLNVKTRLLNQTIAEPLVDPETGEILVEAGTIMTRSVIESIESHLDGDLNKIVYIPNECSRCDWASCSSKIQGCCTNWSRPCCNDHR